MRDVFAHMTATEKMTPPKFVGKLVGSGFRINTMFEKDIAHEEEGTPAESLDEFRAHMSDSTHPPGPIDAMLGEMIVHGEDIRRPLGIAHEYPMDAVVRVADFYKNSNLLIGSKSRVAGLTLRATDTDWIHRIGAGGLRADAGARAGDDGSPRRPRRTQRRRLAQLESALPK